jgi:hypothetical protein
MVWMMLIGMHTLREEVGWMGLARIGLRKVSL